MATYSGKMVSVHFNNFLGPAIATNTGEFSFSEDIDQVEDLQRPM